VAALNILLVDDDTDFAETTAESLREDGHHVTTSPDGITAVVLARELRPDVVLLDLGLPGADGYEIARTLRRELPDTTPIIIVTGLRNASLAVDDDVDLMLNKPIQFELFGGLIEYIRRRRCEGKTSRPVRTIR
jgi:DNA-binding response OmpR family regulator